MGSILGIDLGTHLGWAVLDAGRIVSGTVDLSPRRGDSPGMRLLYLRAWLNQLDPLPELVVYERPHLRGGAAASVLTHLEGEVLAWCAQRFIQHHAVHSARLKKSATGSGRADKAEMCRVASLAVLREITDDNEADAIHLVRYADDLGR